MAKIADIEGLTPYLQALESGQKKMSEKTTEVRTTMIDRLMGVAEENTVFELCVTQPFTPFQGIGLAVASVISR